jgi:hypothetical protein
MRSTLFLILTSITLAGCMTNDQPYNRSITTYEQFSRTNSVYDVVLNFSKANFYKLPDEAQKMQIDCINWALSDLQPGQSCRWDVNNSAGIVKLVNVGSSGCHTLYNSVMHKGKTRNWQENACYNHESETWRIY